MIVFQFNNTLDFQRKLLKELSENKEPEKLQ